MAGKNLLSVIDFRGGLNLSADLFALQDNESPSLLNVDPNIRGGLDRRRPIVETNSTALPGRISYLTQYNASSGQYLIAAIKPTATVSTTNVLWRSSGLNFTAITLPTLPTVDSSGELNYSSATYKPAASNDNILYLQNGRQPCVKYDGATAPTALGQTLGTVGNVPVGAQTASWHDRVWVANTLESSTSYPNRIRFSQTNDPETFLSASYIDIESGRDGDAIQALVPLSDRLLVFKGQSIYMISGYDETTFASNLVSSTEGAVSANAVAVSEGICYFFSWPNGLYRLRPGSAPEFLFERLSPMTRNVGISSLMKKRISVSVFGRRVWVSIPQDDSFIAIGSTNFANMTYIWDPQLGKGGAWTRYGLGIGKGLTYSVTGQASFSVAPGPNGRVLNVDKVGATQDRLDGTDADIVSYYYTNWIDAGQPVTFKRWQRPRLVVEDYGSAVVGVDYYLDYAINQPVKITSYTTTGVPVAGVWGQNWNSMVWSFSNPENHSIEKLTSVGRARSVLLRFYNTGPDWGLNSISLPYQPTNFR